MLYQRIVKTDGVSVGATYYALLINCTDEPFVTELAYPNKPQRDMALIELELGLRKMGLRGGAE